MKTKSSKLIEKNFHVDGMHCAACELVIEDKLKNIEGVSKVHVSRSTQKVSVVYDPLTVNDILFNNSLKPLGYSISDSQDKSSAVHQSNNAIQIVGMFLIVIIGFIILSDLDLFSRFALDTSSQLSSFFALGVIASISSCAALTGTFLLALTRQWKKSNQASSPLQPVALFLAGRTATFALLGFLLGIFGSAIQISLTVTAIMIIVVSIILIIIALQMLEVSFVQKISFSLPHSFTRKISDEDSFQGKYMPMIAGAMTFFLPCGFTFMAQSIALTTGNGLTSLLIMLAFALGTIPALWFIGYSGVSFLTTSGVGRILNRFAAVLIICLSLYTMNSQLNVLGLFSGSDIVRKFDTPEATQNSQLGVTKKIIEGKEYQEVVMEAEGFSYFPKKLMLKVGIPVKLSVINKNVTGCANAMYWSGIYDQPIMLNKPIASASFTPEKAGTYKVSCTMGMVEPVEVIVQ